MQVELAGQVGDVELAIPRDRAETFIPRLVPKGSRPLEVLYSVIYLDALVIKIRDGHHVINKGAKFWAGVCAQMANRGVKDLPIVCCDGLTGFPEAIENNH